MSEAESRDQIETQISRVLRGEIPGALFPADAETPAIRVVPVKTSGGKRPDGLRDDVDFDPGFSFAVSEGWINVDRKDLSASQFERVHRILWEAGTDDWMDYSHFSSFEPDNVEKDATLSLSFSSAAKAAGVVIKLLEALRAAE